MAVDDADDVDDIEADDTEGDGFDHLMKEIDREAREAAQAYFDDLYETSHGSTNGPSRHLDELSDEDSEDDALGAQCSSEVPPVDGQRKGGLKPKLAASPSGNFQVSIYSAYNEERWLLKKGGEFSDVAILIDNVREDLRPLKRAVSYFFLPSTNQFGTIRSFISSQNYSDALKYVQRYVFEENRLDGSESSISIISADMLNQALDDAKVLGSPHAYNMLFFYLNFWLALSTQKLIPDEFCLNVEASAVDTDARRKDVIESINSSFIGWKPYSEEELVALLDYAFFWIDKAIPVIENIQQFMLSLPTAFQRKYSPSQRNSQFEAELNKKGKWCCNCWLQCLNKPQAHEVQGIQKSQEISPVYL